MNRIKTLRNAQTPKMSQEKLGRLVGVGRTAVAMWETDKSEPDNATLIKLAEVFGVSADYLLGRTEQKEQPPTVSGEEPLDEQEKQIMELVTKLSPDQKEFLLSSMKTLLERGK